MPLLLSIREQVPAPDQASQSENSAAIGAANDELLIETVGSKTNSASKVLEGRQQYLAYVKELCTTREAAPAPAVVAATGQREKRKRKFNTKYQDGV